jgi:hypothetical protein
MIRQYKDLSVDGTLTLTIMGSYMSVVPVFFVDSYDGSGLTVTIGDKTYNLPDGEKRDPNIVIRSGETTLTFSGKGTVTVKFRGGRL